LSVIRPNRQWHQSARSIPNQAWTTLSQTFPATGCADNCCDVPSPSQDDNRDAESLGRPSCCTGKPSPCCDVSCLDRLAPRACGDEKLPRAEPISEVKHCHLFICLSGANGHFSDLPCRGSVGGKPCNYHTRKTRDAYAATLEALGCICRALLALGEEPCCLTKERPSRNVAARSRLACSTRPTEVHRGFCPEIRETVRLSFPTVACVS
jgi:hypothetical protein